MRAAVVRRAGRRRPRARGAHGRCLRAEPECEVTSARAQRAGEHNERGREGGEKGRRSCSGTRFRSAWRPRAAQTDRTTMENGGSVVVRPRREQTRLPRGRILQKLRSSRARTSLSSEVKAALSSVGFRRAHSRSSIQRPGRARAPLICADAQPSPATRRRVEIPGICGRRSTRTDRHGGKVESGWRNAARHGEHKPAPKAPVARGWRKSTRRERGK